MTCKSSAWCKAQLAITHLRAFHEQLSDDAAMRALDDALAAIIEAKRLLAGAQPYQPPTGGAFRDPLRGPNLQRR